MRILESWGSLTKFSKLPKWGFLSIWPEWQFCNIQRRYLIYCSNELEFNGRKSYNKKLSTFPKYEDLWWKGRVAFLFWKGSFIKENMIFI